MRVFVLLFNARTENEGIYSMRVQDSDGKTCDLIPMFAEEDDAIRFAGLLEAQDFPLAEIEAIEDEEINEFCEANGFLCHVIEGSEFFLPPENNIEAADRTWNPDDARAGRSANNLAEGDDDDDKEFSESELDRIRRQLEKLL